VTSSAGSALISGKFTDDAFTFKVISPDGDRVITFNGKINGQTVSILRKTDVLPAGSKGDKDLFGVDGPTQFVARRFVPVTFQYEGFVVDITAIADESNREAVLEGLRGQIKIVNDVTIAQEMRAFFRSVLVSMVPVRETSPTGGTYVGFPKDILLRGDRPFGTNPVFLHELMHAYHDKKLMDGVDNFPVLSLFVQARERESFPASSSLMRNVKEYFATTSSIFLHGTSGGREPITRDDLKARQPELYRWLEQEFGPR
jgi:hypothetical protein